MAGQKNSERKNGTQKDENKRSNDRKARGKKSERQIEGERKRRGEREEERERRGGGGRERPHVAHEAAGYPFSFEASDAPKLSKRPQRQYVIRVR